MDSNRLWLFLRHASQLNLVAEVFRALCVGGCALILALLAAVLADAVLGFATWSLVAIDLLLFSLLAGSVYFAFRMAAGNFYDPRRIARRLEQRIGHRGSRLINAVDLAELKRDGKLTSPELAGRTLEDGHKLAETLEVTAVRASRQLWRGFAAAGATRSLTGHHRGHARRPGSAGSGQRGVRRYLRPRDGPHASRRRRAIRDVDRPGRAKPHLLHRYAQGPQRPDDAPSPRGAVL